MLVLDTNVVSELMKSDPDPRVTDWLSRNHMDTLATTVITISEIVYGLKRMPNGKRRNDMAKRFTTMIQRLIILPLDVQAAFRAGDFRAMRKANGLSDAVADMIIAAITDHAGAKLATRNTKDFALLPIEIVNPWQGH